MSCRRGSRSVTQVPLLPGSVQLFSSMLPPVLDYPLGEGRADPKAVLFLSLVAAMKRSKTCSSANAGARSLTLSNHGGSSGESDLIPTASALSRGKQPLDHLTQPFPVTAIRSEGVARSVRTRAEPCELYRELPPAESNGNSSISSRVVHFPPGDAQQVFDPSMQALRAVADGQQDCEAPRRNSRCAGSAPLLPE